MLLCAQFIFCTSHLTPHTSHLTPHTSHLTLHISHLTPQSHLTPHTSHLTRSPESHLTPHTSHLTPHTSHLTPANCTTSTVTVPDRRWLQQRWGEPRQSAAATAEKQRACRGLFQHLPCVSTFFKHTILLNFSFIVSILLSEGSESHRLSNSSSLSHKLQDPTMMTHGWGHFRGTSEPKKASNIEVCCNWHVLLALGCRLRLRGARCSGCPRCSAGGWTFSSCYW